MSDVARYSAAGEGVVRTDSAGPLVVWQDYARLKAEVERLKESLNKMTNTPAEADGVEVIVSFWTKAGSRLPSSYKTFWMNAAKEGKPSV